MDVLSLRQKLEEIDALKKDVIKSEVIASTLASADWSSLSGLSYIPLKKI